MARISRGKFQYLCSLYFVRVYSWPICIVGKHREIGAFVEQNISQDFFGGYKGVHYDMEFFKQTAPKGYYEGVRKIDHEVDLEVFTTIVKVPHDSINLTFHRTKEREQVTS